MSWRGDGARKGRVRELRSVVGPFVLSGVDRLIKCKCGNKDLSRFVTNDLDGDVVCKRNPFVLPLTL